MLLGFFVIGSVVIGSAAQVFVGGQSNLCSRRGGCDLQRGSGLIYKGNVFLSGASYGCGDLGGCPGFGQQVFRNWTTGVQELDRDFLWSGFGKEDTEQEECGGERG